MFGDRSKAIRVRTQSCVLCTFRRGRRKLTPVINIRQKAASPVLSVALFAAALHFTVIKVNLPEVLQSVCLCVWVCVSAISVCRNLVAHRAASRLLSGSWSWSWSWSWYSKVSRSAFNLRHYQRLPSSVVPCCCSSFPPVAHKSMQQQNEL